MKKLQKKLNLYMIEKGFRVLSLVGIAK